ncbi:MAG: calcium/sodium antiporter [Gammaproteobacteria bacterium]|nr:calcium/sodium antiporter [Gammaproteobacteria bacterium]
MLLPLMMIAGGLLLLAFSADRFVDGAAAVAGHSGVPPLLIGMVIVGFGTSAPEMTVSVLSAIDGSPGLALGNAFGSNIANIALILGVVALVSPVIVQSRILRQELPLLTVVTLLTLALIFDGHIGRVDAAILLTIFCALIGWSVHLALRPQVDPLALEYTSELKQDAMPVGRAVFWLIAGLLLMIGSSRMLVWGAVQIAHGFGISDLIIGLTIVGVGTSLPELASSIAACRKGNDDLAVGNIIGSNLFNTTAVVGLAGIITPFDLPAGVLTRDWPVMMLLTSSIFLFGYDKRGGGKIDRGEGAVLLAAFIAYTAWLGYAALHV